MRIIGGHDYYDNAVKTGIDMSVVYVRNQSNVTLDEILKSPLQRFKQQFEFKAPARNWRGTDFRIRQNNEDIDYSMSVFGVMFCGVEYRGIRLTSFNNTLHRSGQPSYMYSLQEAKDFIAQFENVEFKPNTWRVDNGFYNESYYVPRQLSTREVEAFTNFGMVSMVYLPTIPSSDYPADMKFFVNSDTLEDVQFYKVMPVFDAFQKIAGWISGVLPSSANPMVEISDKDKVHKHGYNKWSFRKQPESMRND
jgi:hypothetical protein